MRLKLSKCSLGVRDFEALGHEVSKEGVLSSYGHVSAIRALVKPAYYGELLRFLGLLKYFS